MNKCATIPITRARYTYVCTAMQEHILILFYLFRSRELQVVYFQRRDQRNCLKTIFVGWWFVVLVVQITPQLHHPCTQLSRPGSGGDEQCHRGSGKGTIPALPGSLWVQLAVLGFTKAFSLTQTPRKPKKSSKPQKILSTPKHPLNPKTSI